MLQHDLISTLDGVRSCDTDTSTISPLMCKLHARWTEFGRKPFSLTASQSGFLLDDAHLNNAVGDALQTMRSATHVQPGQTLSCVGCHDQRQDTPPTARSPLASLRAPSRINSTGSSTRGA